MFYKISNHWEIKFWKCILQKTQIQYKHIPGKLLNYSTWWKEAFSHDVHIIRTF